MNVQSPDKVEAALALAAADRRRDLTPEEREALREVLEWWRAWKAWGRLGKIILWVIVTTGAVAAAIREFKAGIAAWFGM